MRYLSWAISTWSLPSRVAARWAKMSRMSWVRSMNLSSAPVAAARERAWLGFRSWSRHQHVRTLAQGSDKDLIQLARPDEGARVGFAAALHHPAHHA